MDPEAGNAFITGSTWALIGLLAGVPILLILRQSMDGGLEAPIAAGAIGAIALLTALTLVSAGTVWVWVLLALMLAICALSPWLCTKYSNKLHEQIDDDYIAKYHAALQRDSYNSGAHAMLAEAYLKKQRYVEAVAHYEAALTISPDPERNPNLTKWSRRLEVARAEKAEWEAKNARRVRN